MPSLSHPNYADFNVIVDTDIGTDISDDGFVFTGLSSSICIMPSNNPKPSTTTSNKDVFYSGKMTYLQQGLGGKTRFLIFPLPSTDPV